MTENLIVLRDVLQSDLSFFFEYQRDEEAIKMTSFPARGESAFYAHWAKIMSDPNIFIQTIVYNEKIAGSILSFEMEGEREVGYWLGSSFWGKGIATQSLKQFLNQEVRRPLFAHIAKQNIASKNVSEKCGFVVIGEYKWKPFANADEVDEFTLQLEK